MTNIDADHMSAPYMTWAITLVTTQYSALLANPTLPSHRLLFVFVERRRIGGAPPATNQTNTPFAQPC